VEPVARRPIVFTRSDLAQLPEDCRAELIEGDLVMPPAPDGSHQLLVMRLAERLRNHLGADRDRVLVAPCDVELDDRNVLQPDVLLLPEGTRPALHPWRPPCPIWVAEIVSPSSATRDRGVKLRVYARFGIREAWLVDQFARAVEVHDLAAGAATVFAEGRQARSAVVSGLVLDVAALFAV